MCQIAPRSNSPNDVHRSNDASWFATCQWVEWLGRPSGPTNRGKGKSSNLWRFSLLGKIIKLHGWFFSKPCLITYYYYYYYIKLLLLLLLSSLLLLYIYIYTRHYDSWMCHSVSKIRRCSNIAIWGHFGVADHFRLVNDYKFIEITFAARGAWFKIIFHWIDLRENLQETMVFTIKYRAFL